MIAMSFDQKEWDKTFRLNVEAKQQELKKLTDDDLMKLHEQLIESYSDSQGYEDAVLQKAVFRECRRRSWAACWFWRRWRKPAECKKWLAHTDKMGRQATVKIQGILERTTGHSTTESEDERAGREIKPRGKNNHIRLQKAPNKIGKPYFWTDRKIYILGATITILGMILLILGLLQM